MDLCLRGSQINLAQREKAKPKHLYQKNIPYATNYRPRSASYTNFKRSNTSPTPFLHRPQSADPKYCTGGFNSLFLGNSYEARKSALNSKRYKSISSSSLLKLLLEEPITRSGCYRDDSTTNGSSPDLRFESNALKKHTRKSEQHRKSTSLEVSSVDDNSEQNMNSIGSKRNLNCTVNKRKMSRESTGSKGVAEVFKQSATKENFFQSNLSSTEKTDLPGRVSFFKTNMSQDIDYSDSENDKNEYFPTYSTSANVAEENISATGVVKFPTYETSKNVVPKNKVSPVSQEAITTCSKKSVHFGNSSNESVLAETFVYSNMTSENCSPSTRSSSTASLQDTTDMKCSCCAHTAINTQTEKSKSIKANFDIKTISNVETKLDSNSNNNQISKSYSDNSVVNRVDQQNTFSNYPENFTLTKTENNLNKSTLDDLLADNDEQVCNSSESVIKNYLEVAASASILCKQEVYQAKATNTVSTTVSKKFTYTKGKKTTSDPKNKKACSSGTAKEDKGLTQFRLDEIESWMTVHESKKPCSPEKNDENICKEQNNANIEIEGDGDLKEENDMDSQMSFKSDHSQEDFMYDDIESVIKEIEEDKKKDNLAERVVNEMELKLNTPINEEHSAPKEERPESPDKYKSILSYLDEIEESCDKALLDTRRSLPESSRSEIEFVVEPDITEDVPKLSDLLMIPNHQLARRVIALSLRANELGNAVLLSKEHVNRIRAEKHKLIRSEKVSSVTRLRDQKKHYETIVKRHQGFIEQLLKDKGSLCEKIAALTRRLESQNSAWEHRLETEVARVKETTLAGEKIKRERWVRENTKRIKELTVKGLEAEINKMNSSHQQEIAELKRVHQQHLLEALEDARRKHEQIENSIREAAAQDRELILEKERSAIRQRFDRQMEQERKSFDEQKEKLMAEFAAERERLECELKNKESEFQAKRQDIQREKQLEMEQAVAELQEKLSRQEEKYQNRINTIEKQYEADFQLWKKEFENQCKLVHAEKENVIRQHYRTERDRQIDDIVKRMDAEALKSTEEHEIKMSRLKEKYEQDLQTLEKTEKSLREKYTETRNNLAESDAQVRNLEAEIKQLHIELEHTKKRCKESLDERDQLRENLRNEVQNEVAAIKNERDIEIEKIHKRVQQAIEKKNTTIDILQKECNTMRERCLKLEAVIRQQRKDYCAK